MEIQIYAETLWISYKKIFPELRGECPKIILSNRLTKTAGYNISEHNTITLGNKFFKRNMDSMLKITLPHELAHQIDYNLHGWSKNRKHHNSNWCAIMMIIGLDPDPYHYMEI